MSERLYHLKALINKIELGQSLSKHRDDLLLEILTEQPELGNGAVLKKLALYLHQPLTPLSWRETDLFTYSKNYHFVILQQDSCLVCQRENGKTVSLSLWQDDRFQTQILNARGLDKALSRLIDPEQPLELLALDATPPPVSSQATTPFQRLLQFLVPEKGSLALIFFYAVTIGFLGLAVPIASQSLVNNIAFGALRQPLAALTMILLLVLGFLTLMKSLQLVLVEMLQRRIFVQVARTTAQRLLQVQSQVFEQSRLSEVVNRFFDVVTLQKAASLLLLDGLSILLATVTGMLLLAFYHPFLLAFDALLLFGVVFVVFGLGIGGQPSSIKESSEKYKIAAWLEELASHPFLFKPSAGHAYAAQETDRHLHNYLGARKKHFRVVLRQSVGAFGLQAIAATALLALGGWLVVEGELNMGQLVAAELVVANVLNSFAKIGKHLETWHDLMASFDKLGYIFDLPAETKSLGFLAAEAKPAQISVQNLSYFAPDHPNRLKAINLELQAGSRSAILGANHWDSRLLLEILYGFRQASQGLVLIDNQPLQNLQLSELRSQVVMLGPLELIDASLLDNLRLGKPDLSRSEAQAVLSKVGLETQLQHLSDGLDTRLKFNGSPFSNAEAYRLMLARALVMQPRFLILDGVLDQIGWQVNGPVSHTLFETLSKQTTLLVITNQIDVLKHFESVYYFSSEGQLSPAPLGLYQTGALA